MVGLQSCIREHLKEVSCWETAASKRDSRHGHNKVLLRVRLWRAELQL